MTASAGLEIGCFNVAFLCEEDPDGIVSQLFQKECTWTYYNQSVTKNPPEATAFALNKMGDFHFNEGLKKKNDREVLDFNSEIQKAADYYSASYLKGEPHVVIYSISVILLSRFSKNIICLR
jgi:hypothetical protein